MSFRSSVGIFSVIIAFLYKRCHLRMMVSLKVSLISTQGLKLGNLGGLGNLSPTIFVISSASKVRFPKYISSAWIAFVAAPT